MTRIHRKINSHINFEKEKGKTNARKDDTEVTCVKCHKKFILPFRPRHPEIYCDECFKKKHKKNKKEKPYKKK